MFIPFCHDELVIATPVTDHYLALKNRETPDVFHDFLKDPIIFREKGSGTKKEMDLFLERTGITTGNLNVIARMNDLESIKKSIVNGLGISILSSRSVNDLLYMGFQNPVFAVDYIETALMGSFLQRKDKNLLCPLQVIDRA